MTALAPATTRRLDPASRAWLAQRQGKWTEGATEIDAARMAYMSSSAEGGGVRAAEARARTGDHTPHLLTRLARQEWVGPALGKIESWLQQIEAAAGPRK